MRIAILESIVMPAGHEVEFDRILVEELKKQGHEPVFFVPEHFPFKLDYHCDVEYLEGGEAISYAGVSRLKRLWLSLQRERRRIAWLNSACQKGADGKCDAVIVPTNSWRVMRSIRHSILKNSKVPFLFMFHGIMPKDRQRFGDGVKSLKEYPNVHLGALGLQTEFPELADFMKTTLVEYRTILENIIKADDGSLNNYYKINHEGLDDIKDARIYYKDICEKVLTNLDKLLDDDDLSVEESLKIINQQKEILELVNKHDEMAFEQEKYYEEKANIKDSEKRQFSWKTIGTISGAIVGVAVITVAALSGGNINLKLPDKKI